MLCVLCVLNFLTIFTGFFFKNLFLYFSPLNYSPLFYLKVSKYDFLYSYEFQFWL